MKKINTLGSMIAGAAVAAAAVGLTVGLAPASAAPTQNGANLWIFQDPANSANYRITVKGVFPMSEHDAHGFINNLHTGNRPGGLPGGMLYHVFGDDPQSNDDVVAHRTYWGAGPRDGGYLRAEADGIHYMQEISVPKSALNEDDGITDDNDEIFATADFVDGDGAHRTQYSNVETAIFG